MADDKDDIEQKLKLIQKYNEERRKLLLIEKDLTDAQEKRLKFLNDELRALNESSEVRKKSIDDLKHEIRNLDILIEKNRSKFQVQEVQRKKQEAADELRVLKMKELLSRVGDLTEEQEKELHILIKGNNEAKKRNLYLEDAISLAAELSSVFSAYGKHAFFNVGKMKDIAVQLKGVGENLGEFGEKLGIGIITNFVDGVINLAFKMSEVEATLRKTTGANESFIKSMRASYDQARENNVSMEDFYNTVGELRTSFIDFTKIGEIAQQNIAEITSTMVQAGHNAGSLSKALNTMTISMGQTGEQAASTLMELDAFARDIGVPPAQLTEQFGAMGSSLAKLGVDGVGAFKDLARVSKITGLEMQKILNLTDKFDTFEGAAEQAGKLNAALGGNFVNAMDLMTATNPVERFEMMRNSLETAGLEFDNMSYYQRKFFAESMGLENVSDLAAMMRGDMGELGAEIGKTSAEYADMAERARVASSFQDRLKKIMERLIPIVEPLIDAFDVLVTSLEKGSNASKEYSDFSLSLGGAFETLVKAGKGLIELFAFLVDHWVVGIAALGAVVYSVYKLTRAFNSGTPGLLTFAAAAAAVGLAAAGIGHAIKGFAELMDVIDLEKVKAFGAFGLSMGIAGPFFSLAGAGLSVMSLGMLAFAAALHAIPTDVMKSFTLFLSSMNNTADLKALDTVVTKLKAIKEVLNEMPNNTVIAVTAMTKAMTTPIQAASAAQAGVVASQRNQQSRNNRTTNKPVVNVPVQVYLDGKEIGYHLRNINAAADDANLPFILGSIGQQ